VVATMGPRNAMMVTYAQVMDDAPPGAWSKEAICALQGIHLVLISAERFAVKDTNSAASLSVMIKTFSMETAAVANAL